MLIETVLLRPGHPRRAAILAQLHDPVLARQMWEDAEHTPPDDDARIWTMVLADGVPAAWCAARIADGELVVSDGYERRGPGRERGLYRLAHRLLHQEVVVPAAEEGISAVTHVFAQPIPLLESDGWVRTGETGPGELPGHVWWQMRRPAGQMV